jgi:hypothetical protein
LIALDQASDHHVLRGGMCNAGLCQSVFDARQKSRIRFCTVSSTAIDSAVGVLVMATAPLHHDLLWVLAILLGI